MSDRLREVTDRLLEFRDARDWKQFHDSKNLAEAVVVESGELLEKFLWMGSAESNDVKGVKLAEVTEEVADVAIFLLYLCERLNIDLLEAVEKKISLNEIRYPVEKARGSSKKSKELGQ